MAAEIRAGIGEGRSAGQQRVEKPLKHASNDVLRQVQRPRTDVPQASQQRRAMHEICQGTFKRAWTYVAGTDGVYKKQSPQDIHAEYRMWYCSKDGCCSWYGSKHACNETDTGASDRILDTIFFESVRVKGKVLGTGDFELQMGQCSLTTVCSLSNVALLVLFAA